MREEKINSGISTRKIDWELQLNYAVKLGLGKREYELIKI